MFYWSILFLIVSVVAGLLGFTSIAGAAAGIAKVIFFVAIAMWVIVFLVISKFIKK